MIKLRPEFVTEFHKGLVTTQWIAVLEAFVTERVQSSGAFKTATGSGTVQSSYNEERFMGPLSVIKYRFDIDAQVERDTPATQPDRYQATVEYHPESGRFSCFGRDHFWTVETQAKYKAESRKAWEEWISSLEPLESKEEFDRRQCPVCSSTLRARFFPEGRSWSFACARDSSHHGSIWMGVRLESGGWWTDFIADRTCPQCNSSTKVVGIMYGLVMMEIDHSLWELGGCTISRQNPNLWYCRACRFDFACGSREKSR